MYECNRLLQYTYICTGLLVSLHILLESILQDKLMKHLTAITPYQHGFVTGKSRLTNFLQSCEDWTSSLDQGCGTDIIFLDFQKAFGTVLHCCLIHSQVVSLWH